MSDDKLKDDVQRAQQVKYLLDNELLKEAFEELKSTYRNAWETTQARDTDGRERLWQAVQIIGKVENHLRGVLLNGEIAQAELDQINKLGERKKIFGVV